MPDLLDTACKYQITTTGTRKIKNNELGHPPTFWTVTHATRNPFKIHRTEEEEEDMVAYQGQMKPLASHAQAPHPLPPTTTLPSSSSSRIRYTVTPKAGFFNPETAKLMFFFSRRFPHLNSLSVESSSHFRSETIDLYQHLSYISHDQLKKGKTFITRFLASCLNKS